MSSRAWTWEATGFLSGDGASFCLDVIAEEFLRAEERAPAEHDEVYQEEDEPKVGPQLYRLYPKFWPYYNEDWPKPTEPVRVEIRVIPLFEGTNRSFGPGYRGAFQAGVSRNGGTPCDTPQGYCACGAWHHLEEWSNPEEILSAELAAQGKPAFLPGGEQVPGSVCDTPQGRCSCGQVHLLEDWANRDEILTWFPPTTIEEILAYESKLKADRDKEERLQASLAVLDKETEDVEGSSDL